MGKDYDHRPFSMPVVKHGQNISGGSTGTMITRAPWQTGSAKYYVINKLIINNASSVVNSGAPLNLAIWDADLSNTGPAARGSSLGPLISLPIPFNVSGLGGGSGVVGISPGTPQVTIIGHDQLPNEYFQGGITVTGVQGGAALTTISGVFVTFELQAV